ncbi:hypothetical protein ACX9Q3_002003 [Klebsiella oxytoca]|uniref:hypothetical protein n=1 Tax=Enterobacteriaceae TaxID=543 RepID=UPI0005ECC527|nr:MULTISPECIES: hypothetical protein [Enterobacteriaceae]EDF6232600.1 hypothetical protein [Salmonella enterica subsp. enterica serovar Senftenberg]EIY9027946.1 hypothetical protein [Salmonella enterica]ELO5147029.1 hypothetical protein [Citrobacter freundii]MDE1513091.1 hypothetical protein [Serratia nevei]HCM5085281.1 hypothetical protein [Klebsiella aerogenes]
MAENKKQQQKEGSGNATNKPDRRTRNVEKIPFSNPEIEHKFTLKTQEAIRLYTRNFNATSQALFNIMINTTRLEKLRQRGVAASAKKAIDAALDTPMKEIELGITAFTEMLNAAGDVSEVNYTNPREFTTSTRTPEATKLIKLFKNYDHIISILDKAYLNALAPAEEVEDTKSFHTSNIQTLAKTIKAHAQSSVEQLQSIAGEEDNTGNVSVVESVEKAENLED